MPLSVALLPLENLPSPDTTNFYYCKNQQSSYHLAAASPDKSAVPCYKSPWIPPEVPRHGVHSPHLKASLHREVFPEAPFHP